jgi:hypothetical protein
MVATPMIPSPSRHFPWLTTILALLAVTFLVLMVRTGSLPETRQRARFEARGVLKALPERVQRVAISMGGRTVVFVRHPQHGWLQLDSRSAVSQELQEHLTMAVLLMHGSGPVRTMTHAEYEDTALHEFGLTPSRYSVVLADAHSSLLEAHFGVLNPAELLQYMRLSGSAEVYLMSRFVGQAWEHIWEHSTAHMSP